MAHRVSSKAWAKNSLTSRLGLQYPIIQGPLGGCPRSVLLLPFHIMGARLVRRSREGVWKSVLEMT
jgi:hypothetical protein